MDQIQGERSSAASKTSVMPEKSTELIREFQETSGSPQSSLAVPMGSYESPPHNHTVIIGNSTSSTPQNREDMTRPDKTITTPPPMAHANIINRLPHGCFGPFLSLNIDGEPYTPVQTQVISGSLGKRKRYDALGSNFPLNTISHMVDLSEPDPSVLAQKEMNAIEINHNPSSIDLNENPKNISNGASSCSSGSLSMEVDKIVEIGKELGFEIDVSNPVLLVTMGVIGETNDP